MSEQSIEEVAAGLVEDVKAGIRVLGAAEFFGIEDDDAEPVDLSKWAGPGATLYVRAMNATERDGYEAGLISQSQGRGKRGGSVDVDLVNARAKLVAICTVNAQTDGVRVFKDSEVKAIGQKNGAMVDALYEVAARLSGITQEDMDETLQDFETGPGGGSSGT